MNPAGMSDDELFGAAPVQSAPVPAAAGLAPLVGGDADLIARAALAEGDASDPKSWQNIAGVIKNRMAATGQTAAQVLSEPGQFESYSNGTLQKVDPKSAVYAKASQAIQPVLTGQVETPYDSFYSPGVVKSRGQSMPKWDDGSGSQVGSQLFFQGKYAPAGLTPDEQAQWDKLNTTPGAAKPGPDPGVTNLVNGEHLPAVQQLAARALQNTGDLVSGPDGTTYKGMPFYTASAESAPEKPGSYWLDPKGVLHQTPVEYNGLMNYANGGLLGFGNKLMAGVQALKASGGNVHDPMFNDFYQQALDHYDDAKQSFTKEHPVAAATTNAAGNLQTVVPSLMLGGEVLAPVRAAMGASGDFLAGASEGNKFLTTASKAANGAIQGAAASAMTAGQSDRPFAQQVATGAVGGGVLGAAAPELINAVGGVANKFTGATGDVSPEVAGLAKTAADKYGIPLRASQIKGVEDRATAFADSERIGSDAGYAANNAAQKTAFTKAVAKTFGQDADRLTPEVMQSAKSRIGGVMNDIAARTTIGDTDGLMTNLGAVVHDAQQVLPDAEAAPLLKQVENIGSVIQEGKLSGAAYQRLTAKGSPLDVATESANPNIRHYAQQIRDTLDDALEASASPEDARGLQSARFQYKNLMTVKNLAAKANVQGEISPSLLNGAVNTSFKNRAFSGAGDLGELAQIGQTFMKEPPNSGTAARLANKFSTLIPGLAGGAGAEGVQLFMHDPVLASKIAAAGITGAALNMGRKAATTAYNLSPRIRNNLIDSSITPRMVQSDPVALNRFLAAVQAVNPPASSNQENKHNRFLPAQ